MKNVIFILSFLFSITIFSQDQQQFDSIFSKWNTNKEIPGVAACVIKDGKIIYLKGFGRANLQTKESITPQTKFQLGELSKQFTTLAILLLEKQGEISFNDNIRKYLPELPKYNHTLTLGNLLNHSSGLYDVNRIKIVVNGDKNSLTQSEALKLITSQKTLSFKPGTDFSHHQSVTESILMAEIVARSSGKSFADFVKTNIFKPLGMKNSTIVDDYNSILTNVAESYQKGVDKEFKKLKFTTNVVGAINAYSTAEDLAKWYLNYTKPQGNIGKLIQELDNPVQLSIGKKFVYYWGEMAKGREFTHPERGLPIFWNYGLQGGYGTNVFRYLDQKITTFVLGNNNQYNGGYAHDLVDVLVEDIYTLPANINFKAKKIKKLSIEKLKSFEGNYWFKEGYASEIFVKNDTLRAKWLFSSKDRYQTLVPLSNNTFQQYAKMEDVRLFKFKKEGKTMKLYFTYNESSPDIMERYNPVEFSEGDLQNYVGTYYNEKYTTLFTFRVEKGELIAKNLNHQDIKFRPVKKNTFTSTSMFFNALTFSKNKEGEVTSFNIVTDGIQNLKFLKIKE